jgi:hypothetical protein
MVLSFEMMPDTEREVRLDLRHVFIPGCPAAVHKIEVFPADG